ncbi:glycosyltransferase [Williamsia herbipolensis]|uniref:Glycosyltransferase n=1 Tax=Williamsia herbipolensis TaxID=1603258 RepID=A0AAU4K2L7_9NOCA|nr:nucleotide disphospho-sugar-binding domain-containing protein [Williamsia herbipolensis]
MRMLLSFYGSRGDVQPGLCLGLELLRRGHDVEMALPPNYVDVAEAMGLRAHPVGLDSESYWESDRARRILSTGNPVTKFRLAQAQVREGFARFDADLAALVRDLADTTALDGLISGPLGQDRVADLAEYLDVEMATVRLCAMSENGAICAVPTRHRLPPVVNRASWRLVDTLTWTFSRSSQNRFRASLGLPAASQSMPERLRRSNTLQIQAYDAALFPGLAAEWDDRKPVVGFFDLPAGRRPAGDTPSGTGGLDDWLDGGAPPVLIAFGSAPVGGPEAVHRAVAEATRREGVRALVGVGGRPVGVDPDNPHLFVAGRLDHPTVLPRLAAAVHHGGAGTTAATLRAGLPTMVCAAGADQAHWGAQITRLGVGTATRLSGLDADTLAAGLRVLADPATVGRARALRTQLTAPDVAVNDAAKRIESAFTRIAV